MFVDYMLKMFSIRLCYVLTKVAIIDKLTNI